MSIRILIKKKVLLEKTSLPRLPSKGGARFGNNLCFVIRIKSPPLKGDLGGCQSEFQLKRRFYSKKHPSPASLRREGLDLEITYVLL